MSETILKAEKRTEFKRSISRTLRKSGVVPGIYYIHGGENIAIKATELALRPVVFTSESHIISLQIDGEDKPISCVLKAVQFDPITGKLIHFDLIGLKEGEKITLVVSVVLKGAAAGVREGGLLQHSLHKLEIECLPQNIPTHFEIDITNLSIGDSVKICDIKSEGVTFLQDESAAIVSVVPPAVEAVAAETAVTEEAPAEPEVISKCKKDEEEK